MTAPSKNNPFNQPVTSVTGLGCVTPAGLGPEALWNAVSRGTSLLKPDDRGYLLGAVAPELKNQLREKWPLPTKAPAGPHKPTQLSGVCYSLEAIAQAMYQAGWSELRSDDGLIFATTTGQIPVWEHAMMQFLTRGMDVDEFSAYFKHQPLALTLNQIADALAFEGPRQLVTSACAASTQALAMADWWIRTGKVRRCLVGATELLCDLTIRGFESFQLLSSEPAKPFDRTRNGINLSEASAFICLEASSPASRVLCHLSGGGLGSDAYHMTSPEPSGRGSFSAMQRALKAAALQPSQIDWLYAHGTGSPHNDAAESAAIQALFGRELAVSSTKAIHGHALAASGIMEAILAILAIGRSTILPTHNFVSAGDDVTVNVVASAINKPLKHVLKNTLGFGGSNASVIFSALSEVS